MTDKQSIKKFLLGTSIKITAIIDEDTADTATLTVDDASEIVRLDSQTMTKEADKVYSGVFQSLSTYVEGDYVYTISVTKSGYTSVVQGKFTLVDQE